MGDSELCLAMDSIAGEFGSGKPIESDDEFDFDWLSARACGYRLLQRLFFCELGQEFADVVASVDASKEILFEEAKASCGQACVGLQEAIAACVSNRDLLDKERSEFMRLFVGPLAPAAPPWESYFRDPDQVLFGEVTLSVREFYRACGLAHDGRLNEEADDHISLELDFMARRSQECLDLAERIKKAELECFSSNECNVSCLSNRMHTLMDEQIRFAAEHLAAWIGDFSELLKRESRSHLYRNLGALAAAYIRCDMAKMKRWKEDE